MKGLILQGKEFGTEMGNRNLTVYATSGCYYMFMSLVPIAMIMCCILPYTPFSEEMVLRMIKEYFAESLGSVLSSIVNDIYASNGATITISILLTLYSASSSMKALMKGMDAAYDRKRKENFIIYTIRALFYMVVMVMTLILSFGIMVWGGKILNFLYRFLPDVGPLDFILSKGRYLLVMGVLFLIFLIFYKVMPVGKVKLREQLPGAVFSAVIWVLFSSIYTIYINMSDKFGAYGMIGTIMVTMMWMYFCFLFLLIGGYLNSYLSERKEKAEGKPAVPEKNPEKSIEEKKERGKVTVRKGRKETSPVMTATGICVAASVGLIAALQHRIKE